jgi:hypothetical protein
MRYRLEYRPNAERQRLRLGREALSSSASRPVSYTLGSGMHSRTLRAHRPLRSEVGCAPPAPRSAVKVRALRCATAEARTTALNDDRATLNIQGNEGASRRRAAPGSQPGQLRRRPNCRCAGQHRRETKTRSQTSASLAASLPPKAHMLKFKQGMSAQSAIQPLPNPTLNRSTNGRPPGPGRRYAVHCLRPGPGVLPSSPG